RELGRARRPRRLAPARDDSGSGAKFGLANHGHGKEGLMIVSTFVQDLNRRRFGGRLGAATVERLEALPDREDARVFLERAAALMQRAGMPAEDFSAFQAEMFASIAAHLLPGCWGGRVPP